MQQVGAIHVVPAGDGWAVEVDGQDGRDVFHSQDRAIKVGRALAWEHHRELLIHWDAPCVTAGTPATPSVTAS
jgi:hypothetical protein